MEEMKNTKKLTDDCDAAIKTAQFRFALIAPLVQGLVPDGSDTAYFMRITKDPLTLPDGRFERERNLFLFCKNFKNQP